MPKRVIVVDIGNTSTSVGVYAGGRVTHLTYGPTHGRPAGAIERMLKQVAGRPCPDGLALASVVPAVNRAWRKAARAMWPGLDIRELHHRLDLGIRLDYPRPDTLGVDRLCNASAALARFGAPVIVCDFGTATTFDVVASDGRFVGGVIAPGPALMFDYLFEKTALLPRTSDAPIRHPVGRSTREAIRMGARWGYRGMVREILWQLIKGLGHTRVEVCATGGYASKLQRELGIPLKVAPDLTLWGIGRIYERNART